MEKWTNQLVSLQNTIITKAATASGNNDRASMGPSMSSMMPMGSWNNSNAEVWN